MNRGCNYNLDPLLFAELDRVWDPNQVTTTVPQSFSNPGCKAVDTFTVSRGKENNWIFPSPYLIQRVLQHLANGNEYGTIILPEWHLAPG